MTEERVDIYEYVSTLTPAEKESLNAIVSALCDRVMVEFKERFPKDVERLEKVDARKLRLLATGSVYDTLHLEVHEANKRWRDK